MSSNDFIPLSAPLGIPGSSYMIQLGRISGIWAVRLAKGNDILDSKVFRENTEDEPPNANSIVGWVIQTLPIPNLNPYQIAKSVGFIRQEAVRRNEELKHKPSVPISETQQVKLTEVPTEKKPVASPGWVKEDDAEEQKKHAHRILPQIPTGGTEGAVASTKVSTSGVSQGKGVVCKGCNTEFRFCPHCGAPLN